jgi:hypothetical protein
VPAFLQLRDSLRALTVATARLWWATLPEVFTVYILAWTLSRLLQLAAAWAGTWVAPVMFDTETWERLHTDTWNQWIAVGFLALSFLALLGGMIVALRVLGRRLGDAGVPAEGPAQRGSLVQTLAVTLLAFLGIYSVFDYVGDTASDAMMDAILLSKDSSSLILLPLQPSTWQETIQVVAVIVVAFVARRLLDALGKRTGWLWLGIVGAALEAFYLLAVFVAGFRVINQAVAWLAGRQFTAWLHDAVAFIGAPLRWIGVSLPVLLVELWRWFWDVGWPVIISSFLQPVLWFALAALVLGTSIASFEDLLHSGRVRLWASGRRSAKLATVVDSLETRKTLVVQLQDAVFGDLDEKYLPAWQVLRLSLRVGVGFLGAYIVVYNLLDTTGQWLEYGLNYLIGAGRLERQFLITSLTDPLVNTIGMTLKLALLAAAYGLAFSDRLSNPEAAPDGSGPGGLDDRVPEHADGSEAGESDGSERGESAVTIPAGDATTAAPSRALAGDNGEWARPADGAPRRAVVE